MLIAGPNGIGKTTLLQKIVNGEADGVTIEPGTRVGYYRQDFSTLDPEKTVHEVLLEVTSDETSDKLETIETIWLKTGFVEGDSVADIS